MTEIRISLAIPVFHNLQEPPYVVRVKDADSKRKERDGLIGNPGEHFPVNSDDPSKAR